MWLHYHVGGVSLRFASVVKYALCNEGGGMRGTIPRILAAIQAVRSLSEGKRLIFQNGVKVNGVVVKDISEEWTVRTGDIITVGRNEIVVPSEIGDK